MHFDMGWQYRHEAWAGRLGRAGMTQGMSRKGNRLGNAAAERAFGHMKDKFLRRQEWPGSESFEADLDDYVVHCVSANVKPADSANAYPPVAPTNMRQSRQRFSATSTNDVA